MKRLNLLALFVGIAILGGEPTWGKVHDVVYPPLTARYQNDVALVFKTRSLDSKILTYPIVEHYKGADLVEIPPGIRPEDLPRGVRFLDRFKVKLPGIEFDSRLGPPSSSGRSNDEPGVTGLFLVQFYGPIKHEWLAELEDVGVEWLPVYIPEFVRLAWIRSEVFQKLHQFRYVNWVGRYRSEYKYSLSVLKSGTFTDLYRVYIHAVTKAESAQVLREMENLNVEILAYSRSAHYLVPSSYLVKIPRGNEELVARIARVWAIEAVPEYELALSTSRELNQKGMGNGCSGALEEVPLWSAGITGSGPTPGSGSTLGSEQLVGILDTHFNHIDLSCGSGIPNDVIFRYTEYNSTNTGCGGIARTSCIDSGVFHGTAVAGIIAGSGTRDGGETPVQACTRKGHAFGARLWLLNCDGLNNALSCLNDCDSNTAMDYFFQASYGDGSRISSHSWSAAVNGDYNILSALVDAWAYDNDPNTMGVVEQTYLWHFATANSGPNASTIGAPATAKDDISVAAYYNGVEGSCWPGDSSPCDENKIVYYSSRGPVEDGRHGADIAGPSQYVSAPDDTGNYTDFNGTSAATPGVAGATALVRDWLINVKGLSEPPAALIKALIMNSGDYIPNHVVNPSETLPGTNQGWGRVNLSNLCDDFSLSDCNFVRSTWETGEFNNAGETRPITVTVVDGTQPLRCMLVWLDPPNFPNGSLINNIDLWAEAPDGSCYPGNNLTGPSSVPGLCSGVDGINPDEGLRVQNPMLGVWTIHIDAVSINQGPQPWSVVCSGGILSEPLVARPSGSAFPGIPEVCNTTTTGTQDYTVTAYGGPSGFSGDINLSFLGSTPPNPGITASFAVNPLPAPPTSGVSTIMTVSVTPGVPSGTYDLSVNGDDTQLSYTTTTALKVVSTPPEEPQPLTPLSGDIVAFKETEFRWQLQGSASLYNFALFAGSGCTGSPILVKTGVKGDSIILSTPGEDLNPDSPYSWSLEAVNACGSSPFVCNDFRTWKCSLESERVINGGFETGNLNGWVVEATRGLNGIPGAKTTQKYQGNYALQLGDYPASYASTTAGEDSVYQEISVPPQGATLQFYAYFASRDTVTFDLQRADITNTDGQVLANIFAYGDDEAPLNASWTLYEVDLSPWAGQTIRVRFTVINDTVYTTGMFIDAVTTSVIYCGPPDFEISMSPTSFDLCAGGRGWTDIQLSSALGYAIPLSLTSSSLPLGLMASIFPSFLTTPGTARLTLRALESAEPGTYAFKVQAQGTVGSQGIVREKDLSARVATSPPLRPILVQPLDESQVYTTTPVFQWTGFGSPGRAERRMTVILPTLLEPARGKSQIEVPLEPAIDPNLYHLLVDDDPSFASPEIDTTVYSLSYQPGLGVLSPATRYYWTVSAANACGASPPSPVFQFDISGCQEGWELVQDLPQGRWGACSVGVNGKLYVFGGFDTSFQIRNEAWTFDPAEGVWTPLQAMPSGRAQMGCVTDGNLIYVIGGTNGINPTNQLWIYNPETNAWTSGPNIPTGLHGPATALINPYIYACGGISAETGLATRNCFRYHVANQVWASTFPLTLARYRTHGVAIGSLFIAVGSNIGFGASTGAEYNIDICDTTTGQCALSSDAPYRLWFDPGAVAYNDKVYILGLDEGPNPRQTSLVYDPSTDSFNAFVDLLTPQNNTTASMVDNYLYVVGGGDGTVFGLTKVERYVFCSASDCRGSWQQAPPIPEGRIWACAVEYQNKLYVLGGADSEASPLNSGWVYDPLTSLWLPLADMPGSAAFAGCAVLGDEVHVIGGWNGSTIRNTHWVYNPVNNTWSTMTPLPSGRLGPAVAEVNATLYVCGGVDALTGLATHECLAWNSIAHNWESAGFSLPNARWRTTGTHVGNLFIAVGSNSGLGESPLAPYTLDLCDVSTHTCTTSTTSLFPLSYNPGVAEYNNEIFLAGLNDGSGNSITTLAYNPAMNGFRLFTPLGRNQNNTAAARVGTALYLVGGYDGQNMALQLVQKYDFCTPYAIVLQGGYNRVARPLGYDQQGKTRVRPTSPSLR